MRGPNAPKRCGGSPRASNKACRRPTSLSSLSESPCELLLALFEDDVVVVVVLLTPPPLLAAVALVLLALAPVAVAELLVAEDVVPPKALVTVNDAVTRKNTEIYQMS